MAQYGTHRSKSASIGSTSHRVPPHLILWGHGGIAQGQTAREQRHAVGQQVVGRLLTSWWRRLDQQNLDLSRGLKAVHWDGWMSLIMACRTIYIGPTTISEFWRNHDECGRNSSCAPKRCGRKGAGSQSSPGTVWCFQILALEHGFY